MPEKFENHTDSYEALNVDDEWQCKSAVSTKMLQKFFCDE